MTGDDFKFQKLTPIHDANLDMYKDALNFVFSNNDVRNVGISGAYSAGKSSVIESYKKTCPEKHFIHISLAYFETVENEENQENEELKTDLNKISENILEGKILNQLVHQIDINKIPQTNFRVKRQFSKVDTCKVTLEIVLFFCAFSYTLGFNSWQQSIDNLSVLWLKNLLAWTTNSVWLIFSAILIVVLLARFTYDIIKLQKDKGFFKKVKVQGNEIEIFEQREDSYFDKYLNEVLYLFDNSNADVIVFEDMDRYNVNQIFQRLREINNLINNRRQKKQQFPIRFFYLLRDDIFVSKDRTKFFDFIIPIVPILDSSNSYDQFIAHFKSSGIFELFDEKFLQDISLYVDDMRILKNIYNEFVIYNKRIGTTEQSDNKLLALIIYKNLFPCDFSDLQLNRGFIFTLFAKKEEFISKEQNLIQKQIENLKLKIQAIQNEILNSEQELNTIYEPKIQRAFSHEEKNLIKERDDRKKAICQRKNGGIEKLKCEVNALEQKRQVLQTEKLCEIINRENIDEIFKVEYINEIEQTNKFNEIKGSEYFDLLKYLMRNGFIDETYSDYMTYFYENSLRRTDKIFLRSVTDEKAKEYTYALKNPEKIVRRLRVVDFNNGETLNFDLFSYLLQAQSSYPEQLNQFMLQLRNNKNFDFIGQFFASGKETKRFIKYVNHHWPQLFKEIIQDDFFNDDQKKKFALSCIYFSANQDLSEMNLENVLSDFIANCSDFLQIDEPKTERIITVLKLLQVKFIFIDYKISNYGLWSEVYSHHLYELNIQMIESILENQYHLPRSDDYIHKNFSLVLSNPNESLAIYIKDNMEQYMDVILTHCNGCISDNKEAASYILNDETIGDEHKTKYIDLLQSVLTSLRSVKEMKWWMPLIQNELLSYSIDNVLVYFFGNNKNLDNTLISFINEQGKELDFKYDFIDAEFGENSGAAFFHAVVQCNSLQNDKYKAILQSLNRYCKHFTKEEVNKEKIDILIDLKIICICSETLIFMRENYRENVLHFISANIRKYVEEVMDENNFLLDEALELLKSDVEDTYKIDLLKFTDEPISIEGKNYDAAIETYILEHNFDSHDLPYLLERYNHLNEASKEIVEKLAVQYVSDIISNEYIPSYELLLKLISDIAVNISDKLTLFSMVLPSLNVVQCKSCLKKMQQDDYLSLFNGKRPQFEIDNVSERILNTFKEKGWITNFKVDNNPNYYRAFGKKYINEKIR